jgi:hypothetical protein
MELIPTGSKEMAENLKVISDIVAKAKRKYRIQSSLKEIDNFWDSQIIKTESW